MLSVTITIEYKNQLVLVETNTKLVLFCMTYSYFLLIVSRKTKKDVGDSKCNTV